MLVVDLGTGPGGRPGMGAVLRPLTHAGGYFPPPVLFTVVGLTWEGLKTYLPRTWYTISRKIHAASTVAREAREPAADEQARFAMCVIRIF